MVSSASASSASRTRIRRRATRLSTVLLPWFAAAGLFALDASAGWDLWDAPSGSAGPVDQEQPVADKKQDGPRIGQSFTPQQGFLHRVDLMLNNRFDYRPVDVRLWVWDDVDGDGLAEDDEYDATVATAPLWQDVVSLPGAPGPVLVPLFPNVVVPQGLPCYLELSTATDEGEWAVYVLWDDVDPYAAGRMRERGLFASPPARTRHGDLFFRTYGAPSGPAPGRTCASTGAAAPCLSQLPAVWAAPRESAGAVVAEDYRQLLEAKADAGRVVILASDGHTAHEYAMYDAFLYRVTAQEWYAQSVVDLFDKAIEWRLANPDDAVPFMWMEHPGWAYEWIRHSPTLGTDDHDRIQRLLLHAAAGFWPDRELGLQNHALGGALTMKLVTRLVPAERFAVLSACEPGPAPLCDGLFRAGEQLDAGDHLAWEQYADATWDEFKIRWQVLEDGGIYQHYSTRFVLQLALLYGEVPTLWQSPGFLQYVERLYAMHTPLGPYPMFGDTNGWNHTWVAPAWLFEMGAARRRDGRYKELARRLLDYHRRHVEDELSQGSPIQPWQALYQEYSLLAHAYFAADPTVVPAAPEDLAETMVAGQDADGSAEWWTPSGSVAQTFRATADRVVRVDLMLRNGGSAGPATVRLAPWDGEWSSSSQQTPLWAETFLLDGGDTSRLYSFRPAVDVVPGADYLVEIERDGPLFVRGTLSPADAYPGGQIWLDGEPRAGDDLWLRVHALAGEGSIVTERLQVAPLRVSQRGDPPRDMVFTGDVVPDKLVLRSGHGEDDLHAVVNLTIGQYYHGQQETGALVSLTDEGSVLLLGSGYADKRARDQNRSLARRHWGGTFEGLGDDVDVDLDEHRATSVAHIDWNDIHGWNIDRQRRILFVKNRFLLVRDRCDFRGSMRASCGTVWHAQRVHPDHGTSWYAIHNDRLPGINGILYRNPERHLLLYTADRSGYETEQWEVSYEGNPPSVPYVVAQRWSGDAVDGTTRWFDTLLLPFGPEWSPGEVAADVSLIHDDGANVIWKVRMDQETWTVVDNPERISLVRDGVSTDAAWAVTRTRPGWPPYVLARDATHVSVDDGPGRRIDRGWPVRTSVEEGGFAVRTPSRPRDTPRRRAPGPAREIEH